MTTTRLISTIFAATVILMTGCGGSLIFQGRVIPGRAGVATVVANDDERLTEEGIPGVEVAFLRDSGSRGSGLIAKATTDEFGDFEIVLGRGQHPAKAVMVRVTGESIFDARTRSFLPSVGQKLLCPVIPRKEQSD